MATDLERQEDEISALLSIFDSEEFCDMTQQKEDEEQQHKYLLKACSKLPESLLKIKYINQNLNRRCPVLPYLRFFVKHLPPAKLYITLPSNYPSQNPPQFLLSVSWLSPLETSRICQKLDDLWLVNRGSEILYIWMEFLKFELLTFLDIHHCLDVSFLFTAYEEPDEYLSSDLASLSDPRASNDVLFLNPRQYLEEYSAIRHRIEYRRNFYTCGVCFEEHSGENCIEFQDCCHVACRKCMQEYFAFKINEGNVRGITCPEPKCKSRAQPCQVKELCPELFERYEILLLRVTLDTMNDIVYCPRPFCQYPVSRDGDENLASCAYCFYNFCVYCRKVYHGVAPCIMTTEDKSKLVNEYRNADLLRKRTLEEKHGRRQLQCVVEKHLTGEYLKENTKLCPNCETRTAKIDGCNKMICGYCQAHFCWLCSKHLTSSDPYQHFRDAENNPCFQRLFEGLDLKADRFEDEVEGAGAWIEFDGEGFDQLQVEPLEL